MNPVITAPPPPSSEWNTLTGSDADRHRAILERTIRDGSVRAARLLETLAQDQPRDQVVRARALAFETASGGLQIRLGDDAYRPTDYALGQVADRARIPGPYLRQLAEPNASPWQHELAAHVLRAHYGNAGDDRILVRSVRGQLRGWLSDRYRRLDSRPLLDALATEAARVGAVPIDGAATETRVALKLVEPTVREPVPGEFVVFGGEWSNSDYGNGVHGFRIFVLRVLCLNGMTGENILKQVHLGTRLSDNLDLSERTHRLDTAASASMLRDVVRSAFGAGVETTLRAIRAAHERTCTTSQLAHATRSLPKATHKAIADAFDSPDVLNLPPGRTAWRASNAISWIARSTQNPEARLDLERAAGTLV